MKKVISIIKREPEIINTESIVEKLENSALELDEVVRGITEALEEKNSLKLTFSLSIHKV